MATDWRCGCGEDNWSSRFNCRNCNRRAPQSVIARNLAARREADRGAAPEPLRSRGLELSLIHISEPTRLALI
eukprot:10862768-Alexandrium_andersonii.AAC.1